VFAPSINSPAPGFSPASFLRSSNPASSVQTLSDIRHNSSTPENRPYAISGAVSRPTPGALSSPHHPTELGRALTYSPAAPSQKPPRLRLQPTETIDTFFAHATLKIEFIGNGLRASLLAMRVMPSSWSEPEEVYLPRSCRSRRFWERCLRFVGYHAFSPPILLAIASYEGPYGTWRWCIAPLLVGCYGLFLGILTMISINKLYR